MGNHKTAVLLNILATLILAGSLFMLFSICTYKRNESYKEELENIPSYEQVEKDMCSILVAERVDVVAHKQDGSTVIYTVEVPKVGGYTYQIYNVSYSLQLIHGSMYNYYKWAYYSNRYVSTNTTTYPIF